MDIEWKTPEELESLALKIIQRHQPDALSTPFPIDIYTFIQRACEKFGYAFEAGILPKIGAQKALGCVDNANKKVFIDIDIICEAATNHICRFVTAHELGHLILHRQYFENGNTPYDYSDLEDGFPINKSLEWQANRFASEILLPRGMVKIVVDSASEELGITRNFGKVFIDGEKYNYDTMNYITKAISNTFFVSKKVSEIRLEELGMIIHSEQHTPCRAIADIFAEHTYNLKNN